MNSAYNVIIRPVISERSFDLMSQHKYTFEVAQNAAKEELSLIHISEPTRPY